MTNKRQLEEFFKSSVIWQDIKLELNTWIDDVHIQLENNSGKLSDRALDRLGGNAEALRNVLDIEKSMLNYTYVQKSNEGENDAN